jgi:flagellar biosynthesis/type III secretory pathway protein FliH
MSKNIDHDQLFKQLLSTFFLEFLDLFAPDLSLNTSEEEEFDREVASIKKEAQKEKVMQIVTSWMERGIEQGLEQGLEQGEQKATLKSVLRVLTRRVGELELGQAQQLQQLSVSQLEELLDAALDFTQMNDLLSWLNAHQSI